MCEKYDSEKLDQRVGDMFYGLFHKMCKEEFKKYLLSRKSEIDEIMDELVTKDLLKSWLQDYVEYNEVFEELKYEIGRKILEKKLKSLLGE